MPEFKTVLYENLTPEIVRVRMNRPEARNAQDLQLTYDLNDAFDAANQDDQVKVIILSGEGPHFNSGHDMRGGTGRHARRLQAGGHVGELRRARRGGRDGGRGGDLPPDVPPLAQPAQADDRRGAGQDHRRRPHAGLGLRHHHRLR